MSHLDSTLVNQEEIKLSSSEIKKYLQIELIEIPQDIKISTMTLEAKIPVTFYPWNILKYIRKTPGMIAGVVPENRYKKKKIDETVTENPQFENGELEDTTQINHRDAEQINIALGRKMQKVSKNRQSDVFLNQVTLAICVSGKSKPVSVKIFKNGTLHFTGCISIDNLLEATQKLFNECKREIAVLNEKRQLVDIAFVDDPTKLTIENLYDFRIDMINCIFVVPFIIDRPKLHHILKNDGYNSSYDSNGHAGVKIKYSTTYPHVDNRETKTNGVKKVTKITIFVFESGSIIIILGKQGFSKINEVYSFIYKYLLENYDKIVRDDSVIVNSLTNYIGDDCKLFIKHKYQYTKNLNIIQQMKKIEKIISQNSSPDLITEN